MPKFSADFKLKCIEAYKNKQPLPKVDGTLEKSMIENARLMVFMRENFIITQQI